MSKMQSPASPVHPPLGTLIDGDSLELVEVLGVGGYGVVYRAVDVRNPASQKSYAVKCLVASGSQTQRQRQAHIREIALHQLASRHPNVVTLHRVVEHNHNTYIIMDFAADHDLFTQILHKCRYLGNDALIKEIFLQMLDAVEYIHNLGIYHRDLKPENILCFEDGLRIAITDFGLATTDKLSEEFRTGSVYHMSPECQGGAFAPGGKYSPMFNDIWSLGIILLNLATGRNPWKSATSDDPTFQAYRQDPYRFLPTVLPISYELNEILVQMLQVDWRHRMRIDEIRAAIEDLTTFYSDGVIFEGSMARCPWEAGMDIDSEASSHTPEVSASPVVSPVREHHLVSQWSKDSTSDIVFAPRSGIDDSAYGVPWPHYPSAAANYALDSPTSSYSSDDDHFGMDNYRRGRRPQTPSDRTESPPSSVPVTPNDFEATFATQQAAAARGKQQQQQRARLTLDTNLGRGPRIYQANASMDTFSTDSDMMHTAIEYDPHSSLFFLASPLSAKLMAPDSAITAIGEDKEMTSPSAWRNTVIMESPSLFSSSASSGSDDLVFSRSGTPSPEPWAGQQQVQSPQRQCQPSSPLFRHGMMTDSPSRPSPKFRSRGKRAGAPVKGAAAAAAAAKTPVANPHLAPPSPTTPSAAVASEAGHVFGSHSPHAGSRFSLRLFPRPTATPPPPPAAPAPSPSVRPSSRGRAFHPKPYPTFGRRKAGVAKAGKGGQPRQQVVAPAHSSASDDDDDDAGHCSSASSSISGGSYGVTVERAERKSVLGRRNATKQWFAGKLGLTTQVV